MSKPFMERYYAKLDHYRQKSREAQHRRRVRLGLPTKPIYSTCGRCGADIHQTAGRGPIRRFCSSCVRRRGPNRSQHQHIVRTCWCGTAFELQQHYPNKWYCRPEHRPYKGKKACKIDYAHCPECEGLFTKRRVHQRFCSKQHANRFVNREYQRRTQATSIRYWRVADTKEAKDLARLYFNLRQELRNYR